MSRLRDRQSQRLFRGRELPRLMTMIVMSGVIFLLMGQARNPSNWGFFAGRVEHENDNFTMADVKRAAARRAPQLQLADATQAGAANQGEVAAEPAKASETTVDIAPPEKPAAPAAEVSTPAEKAPEKPAAEKPAPESKTPQLPGADVPPIESADGEPVRAPKANPDPANQPPTEPAPTANPPQPEQPAAAASPLEPGKPAEPAPQDGRQYDPQPLDEDPEQLAMIREEFQAVTDKSPIAPEEMAAYWRLMRWQHGQKTADLAKRARKDILFSHLFQKPDKYRGELIRLRLHLKRTISDDTKENLPGVKWIYESWGSTDEARNQLYIVVYSDLPNEEMPMGADIMEEATFYGYFFKLMSYKSREDKNRASPVLIGRLVWHPTAKVAKNTDEWKYGLVVFGGLGLLAGLWFLLKMFLPGKKPAGPVLSRGVRLNNEGEEVLSLDEFLDEAETQKLSSDDEEPEPEINGHSQLDARRNGNSLHHRRFSTGLDTSEDPEK